MEKENWVKVCPFCGSENFSVDKSDKLVSSGIIRGYVCSSCKKSFNSAIELMKTKEVKKQK
ncbi:MAG: hypothetical protein HYW50_01110 [Candidatus Diapherotrites archaeon]|nr:hypothetical protein [Candidatus Diapherotrites archaeon]